MVFHLSSENIIGAHILRAAGRPVVMITERGQAGRAAAYRLLTRTERADLLCTLGSGSRLFAWLEAESMAAHEIPEALRSPCLNYSLAEAALVA